MDIHKVTFPGEEMRAPKLKIGIKATKFNGIWFDIPGDQFDHSDIHVLVKVGTGRDHLFAFFKEISVFKDKILKYGQNSGCLSKDEADDIFSQLPGFSSIPAYICGFVKKDYDYKKLSYTGCKGQKHYTIKTWNGPICKDDLKTIKEKENVTGNVKFENIGKFSHTSGYLFNTGSLLWQDDEWGSVIKNL